jgi:hypothetical protein
MVMNKSMIVLVKITQTVVTMLIAAILTIVR